MRQAMKMIPIQKTSQSMDIVDAQSYVHGAEAVAEKLVKKHGNDLLAIKKEISEIQVPSGATTVKGFNFKKEVLWAIGWICGSGDKNKKGGSSDERKALN